MRRQVPLLIASLAGCVMIITYFSPALQSWSERAGNWYKVILAISLLLGGINLVMHHARKVVKREAGWGFAAVTLAAFFLTMFVGLLKIGTAPNPDFPRHAWSGDFEEEGAPFWWLYTYVFMSVTASMFSLLAFYVASAAFRAFLAKNVEASLLLGTAVIVLIGRSSAGAWLAQYLPVGLAPPELTTFIMQVFTTAGQRAIMIGIALGLAATSLRILLGMDNSFLGGESE